MQEHTGMDIGVISDWFEYRPINRKAREGLDAAARSRLDFVGVEWSTLPDGTKTGQEVKMLDYACGPGAMTRIYGPYVSEVKAIDLEPAMVERYNKNKTTWDVAPGFVSSAIVGNLLSNPVTIEDRMYEAFDLITVGAALHHFPSAVEAVTRLAQLLRPGGVLLIQDLYSNREEKGTSVVGDRRKPHYFHEDEMKQTMEAGGLVDFRMEVYPQIFELELPNGDVRKIECFIARAAQPKD
ncbi:S-adenosyl-L-methionine-dependent methyltransferase [Lophiotrema nucula]|uniref:S-adenosyl-L-methionine-dependent methyltransferase n=1 Tax=Lophiotrema nucula TaxID=690887 RepID=A0A6A5ZHW2_9PLEO|nr:S-adenosyl-L-methionine-dependent methyltransferase [Lophiotrema nucula]